MAVPDLAPALSIEKYLSTAYRPDCDFIDGYLEERSFGKYDHATIQTLLAIWFGNHEREWWVRGRVELRVQVADTRFRVPDLCVLPRDRSVEQIVRQAPLICIEVLSPDDSLYRMRDRVADYLAMGVPHVWLINPASSEGLVCTATGWNQPPDGRFTVPGTDIYVPLAEIFAGLDES